MFFKKKSKLLIGGSLGVSLLGVLVAAIATSAWFSLDSQPVSFSGPAANTNLSIDNANVTGYKIKSSLGTDGFPDYSSSTVASKKGTTYEVSNHNQDIADTNFDVPEAGLGYYLVKKNAENTYKYKYNDTSYSWKFKELDNGSVNYMRIDGVSMTTSQSYIIRKYSYETSTYSTVNEKVKVVKDKGNFTLTLNPDTWEITPSANGTYNIWFNKNTLKVSFETSFDATITNVASALNPNNGNNGSIRVAKKKNSKAPRKNAVTVNRSKAYILISKSGTVGSWGNITELKIDTYTTYNNTDSSRRKTCSNSFSEDADFYYYEIATTVKDVWLSFKQNNTYYYTAHHTSSQYSTYSAATVYYISDFVWIGDGSETAYYNFSGWNNGDKSWNSTNANDRGLVGMTMSNSTYSLINSGTRTVYLYDKNGAGSYYGATPYAHVWQNAGTVWPKSNEGRAFPGKTMTKERDYFYSITVSTSYDRIIFSNGSSGNANQSTDLTIQTNSNSAWKATGVRTGSWYNPDTYKSGTNTFTVYLYDPNAYLSSPKIHVFDTSYQYNSKATWPGSTMTASTTTPNDNTSSFSNLYKFSFNSNYTGIIFTNSGGTIKTNDIAVSYSTHNNKIFVLTSQSDSIVSGDWYIDIPKTATYTIYYFDNRVGDRWASPSVYAWSSTDIVDGTYQTTGGIKNLYKAENTSWSAGAIAMSNISSSEATTLHVSTSNVWKAVISQSYDSVIFTNGASSASGNLKQTIDLMSISSHDGEFFVVTGESDSKFTGEWHDQINGVNYYATFWLDGTTQLEIDGETALIFDNSALSPALTDYTFGSEIFTIASSVRSAVPNSITKTDTDYGIVYYFEVTKTSSTVNFYTDEECEDLFDDGNDSLTVTDGSASLYIKYTISSSALKTFYIDLSTWNASANLRDSGNTSTYFSLDSSQAYCVATNLYRVTLRDPWEVQIKQGNENYNLNGTINTGSMSTKDYVYVSTHTSSSSFSYVDYKTTSATDVWVQKYSGGAWNNVTKGQLLHGDGTGNKYILESGLSLTNGDKIRVYDNNEDTAYGYSSYVSGNKSKHRYVATADGGDAITISNLGAAGTTARFNFYITAGDELSIAMVPDFGNGYYIMEYDGNNTENYIGAIKMDSQDYSATYEGYYCSDTDTKIYIRRYLNAVDEICTSLSSTTDNDDATMKTSSGNDQYTITFGAVGHYTIRVTGLVVDIIPYDVDDFFSVNKLDLSLVTGANNDAKQQSIYDQHTAVVIEIPFTANNTYDTTVSLKTNSTCSFIGIRFAVYTSKQGTPYETMRGNRASYTSSYLTAASTKSFSDSRSTTISAGTSTTCYAYVLIDYLYSVTSSNLTGATPEIDFYLQINQK